MSESQQQSCRMIQSRNRELMVRLDKAEAELARLREEVPCDESGCPILARHCAVCIHPEIAAAQQQRADKAEAEVARLIAHEVIIKRFISVFDTISTDSYEQFSSAVRGTLDTIRDTVLAILDDKDDFFFDDGEKVPKIKHDCGTCGHAVDGGPCDKIHLTRRNVFECEYHSEYQAEKSRKRK